jgi:mono/diheme cytochrome c family protein
VDFCFDALTAALRSCATALALYASAACAQSQPADTAAVVEAGRKAYTSYCTRCHGINLVVTGNAS